MLQPDVGAERQGFALRLEHAYYELMSTTSRHFGSALPGGFLMGVAGFDTPTMNRAVVTEAEPVDADVFVEQAVGAMGERQVPWSVVLPTFLPVQAWHLALIGRGFTLSSRLEVMALASPPRIDAVEGVTVREVRHGEMPVFIELLLDIFTMPRRFYAPLSDMTEAWRRCGSRCYFAEVDGTPVGTALLSLVDGVAGVYNVGTLRTHRRRGIASALMRRLLEDAHGADVKTLQVAPGSVAESFYLRLGFESVYAWRFYTPGPRVASRATRWNASPG